ncbi:uncharacterized protein BT62DRAFT_986911 [Guyanagaster necrorhizus]|uniref:Sacsin/Nov domain-containing protein n=1 Tax=Guyanagaster necrorhizus TaxID=856835 RepID=A0A9P8AU05_9AGAR|nr:uncharacterized protein BT62DRAFT_986911 [Guyanagaster necrorhizus MCA 3950]KAG7446407.1 hypothetical protein BT62DRAFT_986911 [Guyanagaster necrorhizus MCA 3950]
MAGTRDALWATGHDESVEVNQRALIDKVLARYSGEFTVFRELLQNSDDAQATAVEIHFQSKHFLDNLSSISNRSSSDIPLPDLSTILVHQWTFKNNGIVFRHEDWSRLKRIAEGNPDEEKIGAFGVGFYSLFSVTEEPFVTSGGEWMGFYWKDRKDQLFARRGTLPDAEQTSPWTSFDMVLREDATIPPASDFARFLASSITFMNYLSQVSVYMDEKRLIHLTKSSGADERLVIPRGLHTSSRKSIMHIKGIKSTPLHISAQVMQWVYTSSSDKPSAAKPVKPQANGGFFSSLFTNLVGSVPPPPEERKEVIDPRQIRVTSVSLSIYSADVDVRLDKKLSAELHRSTKKNPPSKLKYELIYTGKDEYDASKQCEAGSEKSIFQGLRADIDGTGSARIFIGHSTGQTTGLGGHMAARFIPTVERESIDLMDRAVAVWNQELLFVGGFLARVAYELELSTIRNLWEDASTPSSDPSEDIKHRLTQRSLHSLKFFTFHPSTPSGEVAGRLEEAFFSCANSVPFSIITSAGVRKIGDARMPDATFSGFLTQLPVIPTDVLDEARPMITSLQNRQLLKTITFDDVLKELRSRPLSEAEAVACLKWWSGLKLNVTDRSSIQKQLLDAVIMTTIFPGSGTERIVPLNIIQTFVDPRYIPPDDPLPDHVLPYAISKQLSSSTIKSSFPWTELTIRQWIQHVCDAKTRSDLDHDIGTSAPWAEHVLIVLSRSWTIISPEMKGEIIAMMKPLKCIPTSGGLKIPEDVYFPGANIFHDLPVVLLPSGAMIRGSLERVMEGLGVRRDVELQTLFNKMIKTNEWTVNDLMKHLATRNLSDEEITRLRLTAVFPKQETSECVLGAKSRRYAAKDLYEPLDIFRQLGLPVLDWGVQNKWRSSSPEAKLAFTLNLRQCPPVDVLVNLCAGSDEKIRTIALKYLTDNMNTKYQNFDPVKFGQVAFIPAVRDSKVCLGTPGEVFASSDWAAFGFLVTPPTLSREIVAKLKVPQHPPSELIVSFLLNNVPRDESQAKQWFEILSGRIADFDTFQLTTLSRAPVVPAKEGGNAGMAFQWIPPNQCYFRRSSGDDYYSRLFFFVDFGPAANAFLTACGTRQEPSVDEIARTILQNPGKFYESLNNSPTNYIGELRKLAIAHQQISADTLQKMRRGKILLGLKRKLKAKAKTDIDDFDDDEWDTLYDLKTADEIVIADDTNAHQLFSESLFTAPQEDILEAFYMSLGSRRLSSVVEVSYKTSAAVSNSKTAIEMRNLILERLPLFLHEHTHSKTKFTLTWLASSDHFVVAMFGKLSITKKLRFGDLQSRSLDASAYAVHENNRIMLFLAGSGQDEMYYEVATSLNRLLFESPKASDALLFMTILSTPLRALKRRGYNVDRILRQQQAEKPAAQEAAKAGAENIALMSKQTSKLNPSPGISNSASVPDETLSDDNTLTRSASSMRNTFQNLRRKIGPRWNTTTPYPPVAEEVKPTENYITDAGPPPVPDKIRSIHPSAGKPSGASRAAIMSNVDMAISACRPEKNHLLQNREHMRFVKESLDEGYCDLSGHSGTLKLVMSMEDVKIYLPQHTDTTRIKGFLSTRHDSIARFIHVMNILAAIYKLPMENLHIFSEDEGTTVAFNRNGSIFLNLRYYIAWHDEQVRKGDMNPAIVSWYFTLAHEIAHNLVQPHNSEHEFYLSAICEKHLMELGSIVFKS